jgi:phosphorylcholine metabolism protein LicD
MNSNTRHLNFLNQFFREHNLRIWLDSGALLGLVRTGQLISWDSDIDLGMWDRESSRLDTLKPALRELGYNLSSRKYDGKVYGYTIAQRMAMKEQELATPVHIHVYFHHGTVAWSPQTVLYKLPPHPQFPCEAVDLKARRLWVKGECALKGTYVAKTLKQRLKRSLYKRFFKLYLEKRRSLDRKLWSTAWPYRAVCKTYTWVIPAHFFENLETLSFHKQEFLVPSATEDYLAARYGSNWKEPDPFWCYWRDDHCLRSMKPEEWLGSDFAEESDTSCAVR